jgi:hypothetical protein
MTVRAKSKNQRMSLSRKVAKVAVFNAGSQTILDWMTIQPRFQTNVLEK